MLEVYEFHRKGRDHRKLVMSKEEFDTLQRLVVRTELRPHPEHGATLAYALMPEADGLLVKELLRELRNARAKPELTALYKGKRIR